MASFISTPETVVEDMVQGVLLARPDLVRLEGHAVLLRRDYATNVRDAGKVAVLSGGGSGHEPAHAGFVGQGMLTGAICGGVFASPSVQAVLDAVRCVTGPGGCLLIVKNYTGDRLNFGIAAEQARSEGYAVRMVIVGDDVAVNFGDESDGSVTGRRGLAGTLFVHKVAGAAAEAGATLDVVEREAMGVAQGRLASYSVATTTCDVPGVQSEQRIADGEMEMGLGIHNEPGRSKEVLQPMRAVIETMLARVVHVIGDDDAKSDVAIMVNNLGSATQMELFVALAELNSILAQKLKHVRVVRTFLGTFMTSLNMHGIMVTICAVNPAILSRLDAQTGAPAWPSPPAGGYCDAASALRPSTVALPAPSQRSVVPGKAKETDGGKSVREAIARLRLACQALLDNAQMLNDLDKIVGDGDTGTTFRRGSTECLRALDDEATMGACSSMPELCAIVATSLRKNMGGSSGAILDILLHTAAASLRSGKSYAQAFKDAVEKASFYGGAKPGFRTMLDALFPAAEAAASANADLNSIATAAEAGAEATKHMRAKAGRSSYLAENITDGHADPGAVAMAIALRAMSRNLI
eukprot:g2460.t1